MAEDQDERNTEDLSDEPSPHKLEDFRRKGRVAQSREISGMVALLAAGSTIFMMGPSITTDVTGFMRDIFIDGIALKYKTLTEDGVLQVLGHLIKLVAYAVLPIAAVAMILGSLGSFAQVGSIFSTEPLKPDLKRINPISGAKKFLSLRQLYDGFRIVFKGVAVAGIGYYLVKDEVLTSRRYILTDPANILTGLDESGRMIFYILCGLLLVFAAFDYWIQKWEYSKGVRLTKKEQKQEHKDHEGDPLIKARIRSVQREMARKRMMDAVKTADVIVTNPTHIAIALKYSNDDGMAAPKVVAKGADFLAQKIKKLAADSKVPLVENVPLARTLYKSVKVGQFIPRALYQAVAEVLAYVYRLKEKEKRGV